MKRQIEAYRDTFQDTDWPSWKSLGEINLERARYLLSTDQLLEEILGETHGKITDNMKVEFIEQEQLVAQSLYRASGRIDEQSLICSDLVDRIGVEQ